MTTRLANSESRFSVPLVGWLSARALSLTLAALALLIHGIEALYGSFDLVGVLQLDTARPHEAWRMLSAHWTHWSANHLLWDVLMFAALGAALEAESRRRFVGCVLASALAISVFALLIESEHFVYHGLSGIDSALFVAFVLTQLRHAGRLRWLFVAALLGFGAKLGFECWSGGTLFADGEAYRVYLPAHALGGLVAVPFGNLGPKRRRLRPAPCR